jgi:phage antirepressor YoqD-like protein
MKTPFQEFIEEFKSLENQNNDLDILIKKYEAKERNFINLIYENGYFHAETKRKRRNFYDTNINCGLKKFIQ